jgi:predicted transposase/invertase (TIGR01784 family)
MNEYQQSLKIQRDNYSAMKASNNEVREEERAKALAEKKEIAREMLADNTPINQIAKYTKLSIEDIEAL